MSVSDNDRGWQEILRQLKIAGKANTTIGVQAGEKRNEGVDLVTVAAANELGTSRIPARPAMTITFEKNVDEITAISGRLLKRITGGELTTKRGLVLLGEWYQAKVQQGITDLQAPPNAASTIRRKGSSNPLIDTGQYRQSIRYKVNGA